MGKIGPSDEADAKSRSGLKYDKRCVQALVKALENGGTIKSACARAGISRETFYAWSRTHPGFAELMDRAEQEAVQRRAETLCRHAKRSWMAALMWLKHRHPEDWHEKEKDQGPTAEDMAAAMTVLAQAFAAQGTGAALPQTVRDAIERKRNGAAPTDTGDDGA